MIIIDRRKNTPNKSSVNRKRVMDRSKSVLEEAVKEVVHKRSISSSSSVGIKVSTKGLDEPTFRRIFSNGKNYSIMGGNRVFVVGDRIPKTSESQKGSSAGTGSGEDAFQWILSKDEYLDLIFDGLELPKLLKKTTSITEAEALQRDGIAVNGSPSNLDTVRSLRKSIGRRTALHRPTDQEVKALQEEIKIESDPDRLKIKEEQLQKLLNRRRAVPWMDPVDLRYRHYEIKLEPISKAVVFMIMDVSGSMEEYHKDIAKRFFLLFYTFLMKKYKHVDIIFISHTDEAYEVTEDEFFYSTKSGGTLVSEAFKLMLEIQRERYSSNEWNLYCAQASDGDNMHSDNPTTVQLLEDTLELFQNVAYIEVGKKDSHGYARWSNSGDGASGLWSAYNSVTNKNFVCRRIVEIQNVYPVFREIFAQDKVS